MVDIKKDHTVVVSEVGPGPFVQSVTVRGHKLLADEPLSFPEGTDKGLSPNDFLLSSLGSCTSITLRMYARLKKLPLEKIIITLNRSENGEIDRKIELTGNLTSEQKNRLFEISNKCPIHKVLTNSVKINSELI
ncbi:COG1765 Predicted redox protein, regulator of disulfide bond formation [Candidatus Pelagibacterales bacterium]